MQPRLARAYPFYCFLRDAAAMPLRPARSYLLGQVLGTLVGGPRAVGVAVYVADEQSLIPAV